MNEEEIEEAVRGALAAAAAAVRVEPDRGCLAARIERRAGRDLARARLAVAAAVVALGTLGGGAAGSLLGRTPVDHTVLSDRSGGLGGALPVGPLRQARPHPLLGRLPRRLFGEEALYGRPPGFKRTGSAGVRLALSSSYLGPTLVEGGGVAGCYGGTLVSSSVHIGNLTTGADGVVGMEPLSGHGLEVVDSGAVPAGEGLALWWVTVAVGADVGRVAAEPSDGVQDAMRPVDGVALLGGLAPSSEAGRFFSVVAEDARSRSVASVGFPAGFGASLRSAPAGRGIGAEGCVRVPRVDGAAPREVVLSAEEILAAYEQAYGAREASERMAAVSGLPEADGSPSLVAPQRPRVGAVEFLSPHEAVVTYRLGRRWQTGAAVLGTSATWHVALSSYYGDVTSTGVLGRGLKPLAAACGRLRGGRSGS